MVEGLSLSVTGISVTFAALGLLILAMIVLERIFRTRPIVSDEEEPEETPIVSTLERDTEDEQVVAAIAVALAHLRSLDISRSGLGTALEAGHGSWWMAGRIQQRPMDTLRTYRGRR